jgi:hypothetical protein
MAVAIPLVASFAAGAAGVAAIGTATTVLGTIAAYATVAGAVMTGVGALTGKKDLVKIGGILSLAGGLGTLATGAGNGAAASAGGATGGGEAVDQLAAEYAAGASGQTGAAAGAIGDATSTVGASVPVTAPQAVPMAGGADMAGFGASPQPLMQAGQAQASQAAGGLNAPGAPPVPTTSVPVTAPPGIPDQIQQYAQGQTMGDMQSFWDRVKGVPAAIKSNPEMAKLIGQTVSGGVQAYGQAQQNKLLEEQQNYQRSLMERARANLNNPIRITYGAPRT